MAADNFAASLAAVLVHEGGKVDDPRDKGGRTNHGVTQKVYDDWRRSHSLPVRDVWQIADDEVSRLYKSLYWDRIRADELPKGLDYAAFDLAVNSGVNRAARFLQRIAGVVEDGVIGPATLAALKRIPPARAIELLSQQRQRFLESLPTFDHFGKGWTRRVAEVSSRAGGMA